MDAAFFEPRARFSATALRFATSAASLAARASAACFARRASSAAFCSSIWRARLERPEDTGAGAGFFFSVGLPAFWEEAEEPARRTLRIAQGALALDRLAALAFFVRLFLGGRFLFGLRYLGDLGIDVFRLLAKLGGNCFFDRFDVVFRQDARGSSRGFSDPECERAAPCCPCRIPSPIHELSCWPYGTPRLSSTLSNYSLSACTPQKRLPGRA